MPREIISLAVGQCGNQVSKAFWQGLMGEHGIEMNKGDKQSFWDPTNPLAGIDDGDGVADQLEMVDVYFTAKLQNSKDAIKDAKFIPRAVMVDLEPGTINNLKESDLGPMFNNDALLHGANGAGNNWAKGHYTEGAELVDSVLDAVRIQAENCDCPQAFQLMHSLGGGTGSGMGTLILLKIRDAYPDRITCTFSIFPSPKVSDTVVEPYNAVLSSHQLLENSDETFIIDNEALYNIMHNVLKDKEVAFDKLNALISQVACGLTASLRFPGLLNGDLRKLGVNLVPFPRLHFFLVSQSPLLAKDIQDKVNTNVKDLITQSKTPSHFYSNVKPDDGKYLAASYSFRGIPDDKNFSTAEIEKQVKDMQKDNSDEFVDWIPSNVKTGVVTIPPVTSATSATFIANSTALKGIFQRLATQFGAMYKRKAFLHWYKGEGMDEMEFQEADKNVRDLITEYQDKQDASYVEESEEEENEDS